MPDETGEQELFRRDLLNPTKWLEKADALIGTAETLEHELDEAWTNIYVSWFARRMIRTRVPVYLMLMAYAVENLLKAFIVRSRQNDLDAQVSGDHALPNQLKSHDLLALAAAAGVKSALLTYRQDLLKRMVRSAVWYGRYPVPSSVARREPAIDYLTGADIDEVRCLVRDLRAEFATGTFRGAV